jgi:hypothetical protein
MGSATGVPLAAAEPRITAAVFGLAGHETLAEAAARVTIPLLFLLQWDDEQVPRESGLALFDAFASREKSLHANPAGTSTCRCPRWRAHCRSSAGTSPPATAGSDSAASVPASDPAAATGNPRLSGWWQAAMWPPP